MFENSEDKYIKQLIYSFHMSVMKKLLFILPRLLLLLTLIWCWSNDNYYSESDSCTPPSNPYNDNGWHDAWFDWAERTWWYCDWNSQSFNEWCEEYYSQQNSYDNCVD